MSGSRLLAAALVLLWGGAMLLFLWPVGEAPSPTGVVRDQPREPAPQGGSPSTADPVTDETRAAQAAARRIEDHELLRAFGWGVRDLAGLPEALRESVRDAAFTDLLGTTVDDENVGDAFDDLAVLEEVGLAGAEDARRLFEWCDRNEARQLARASTRVLVGQGAEGQALAARLAANHWQRFLDDPGDNIDFLTCSYVVEELARADVESAAPQILSIAADCADEWWAMAQGLSDPQQRMERLRELESDPERARKRWELDPDSVRVDEFFLWRSRTEKLLRDSLRLDSEEVARQLEDVLLGSDIERSMLARAWIEALCASADELAPDGPVARRMRPLVLQHLAASEPDSPSLRRAAVRLAGLYGAVAVDGLLEARRVASTPVEREDAIRALARAAETSDDPRVALDLRAFLDEQDHASAEARLPAPVYDAALRAAMSGPDVDPAWLHGMLEHGDPARTALVLELAPADTWRTRPEVLAELLERMEGLMDSDANASLAADALLARLAETQGDPLAWLERFARSPQERLRTFASARLDRARLERAATPAQALSLLAERMRTSDDPFRRIGAADSLWNESVTHVRELADLDALAALPAEGTLRFRFAACRGLALREDELAFELACAQAPELLAALVDAGDADALAPRFLSAHWKTVAWLATRGAAGRASAQRALAIASRTESAPGLAARLELLTQYLATS